MRKVRKAPQRNSAHPGKKVKAARVARRAKKEEASASDEPQAIAKLVASPESSAPRKGAAPGLLDPKFPTVALVGRPNVGKSSLFNALLKEEISITDARAGTTRDRVLHPIRFAGRPCDLLDTGGIGIVDQQDLSELIEAQIDAAVATATVLALVVDAKEGLTPPDRKIAERLRMLGRPVVVVANKAEGREAAMTVGEFSALGFEPVISTSALHRLGLEDLEHALAAHLPESDEGFEDWAGWPKIAVVGRRNVGKSTFVNALTRQQRTIVSDVAGTTRDAVDLPLQKDNRRFVLIDTAGLRRIKEPHGPVEFFAQVRTERAIRRADVVMLMIEAKGGISTTDRKAADQIADEHKPCVIVVNKWDTAESDVSTGEYAEYVGGRLGEMRRAPVCFTTAKEARRCWQTIDVALELYDMARSQVPTPKLNQAIERAEREHEPPARKGCKPRLLYGVQVGVGPPTFVIYCRHSDKIDEKYKRYLQARLCSFLGLEEIPLRLFLRDAGRKR
ncbi:MAG: ribosome biogenesis GTPase Der [Planctomycetes bacterium]|nr:ribosome biogenesis GTPase Der [Planctomycetota bacterium]